MSNSWSYSSYSTALQCLQKYKYIYVDKLIPEGSENGDLVFGSALHSAINATLTGEDGQSTFELYWDSYKEKELEYGRFKWAELAQIGAEFIRKFCKGHAKRYSLEFAEKRLFAEYKGIGVEGTLDYYGDYDGRKALRDFKTSGRNYEAAKRDCAIQLYLYSYLYKCNHPESKIETLGYTVFNKGTGSIQDLTWDFSETKMYQALDEMHSYILRLDSRGSAEYPKNYNACLDYGKKCPFWGNCHGEK